MVSGQVTAYGTKGDWAEDADAHPVGLIASPSYRQIPKHFLWQWAGGGTAIGDWAEDGGCPILVDSCATRATVESSSATENLPPHGTGLLEKKESADIFETYLRLCIMVSINQEALSKQENQRQGYHAMNQLEFLSEEANTDFTRQ